MEYRRLYKNPQEWLHNNTQSIGLFLLWDSEISAEEGTTWPDIVRIDTKGVMESRGGPYTNARWGPYNDEHTRWVPISDIEEMAEELGELSPLERRRRDKH